MVLHNENKRVNYLLLTSSSKYQIFLNYFNNHSIWLIHFITYNLLIYQFIYIINISLLEYKTSVYLQHKSNSKIHN